MKIEKFNENSTDKIGIYVIVTIPEDKRQINLNDLTKDSYYLDYKDGATTIQGKESLINYSIEHYIFEQGLLKFSYKLVDESGTEVKIEDLDKRIELNDNTNKFNI